LQLLKLRCRKFATVVTLISCLRHFSVASALPPRSSKTLSLIKGFISH